MVNFVYIITTSTKASYKYEIDKLKDDLYCLEQNNVKLAETIENWIWNYRR